VVVIVPDMTRATESEYLRAGPEGEEAENRVAYVAVTRARKGLIVVEPQTRRFYPYWRLFPARRIAQPACPKIESTSLCVSKGLNAAREDHGPSIKEIT
jgi:superfamily I DNA/RNA helicase